VKVPHNEKIDDPAWPLVQAVISYWGTTSAAGNAFGTSIIDGQCTTAQNQPSYEGLPCKILDGPSAGQMQIVWAHNLVTGELSFANPFTNPAGLPQQQAASIRFVILSVTGGGGGPGPSPGGSYGPTVHLCETWQDELGIDFTIWTTTNPATGAAWARGAVGELLMAHSAPNANELARLRSNQRWVASPTLYGTARIWRRLYVEFEVHLVGLANCNNATFFLGLTTGIADTRATNNIMGWGLVGAGNALQTVTDAGGAETVNTGFGENLLITNKLKMEIALNSCEFSLNEAVIANHVVNLPDAPFYLNFLATTGAGGAATIRIGTVRIWGEDVT